MSEEKVNVPSPTGEWPAGFAQGYSDDSMDWPDSWFRLSEVAAVSRRHQVIMVTLRSGREFIYRCGAHYRHHIEHGLWDGNWESWAHAATTALLDEVARDRS